MTRPRSEYPNGKYPCETPAYRAKEEKKEKRKRDARRETLKESFLRFLPLVGEIQKTAERIGTSLGTVTAWRDKDAKFNAAVMDILENLRVDNAAIDKEALLAMLAETGSMYGAAKNLGMSLPAVRKLEAEDEEFRKAIVRVLAGVVDEVRGVWLGIVRSSTATNRDKIQAGEKIAKLQGEMIERSEIKSEVTHKGGMAELSNALDDAERREKAAVHNRINPLKADRQ